jgi:predicted ATPase/DNA-binding winged helix-turn-helix (wHTH) protein
VSDAAAAEAAFHGVATFGPYRLRVGERLLEREGMPVKIGSRALDILTTLVERSPAVVSKRELISRAWGTVVVDEGSLRFHITALRRTLGDTEDDDARYVTNVTGRGYCFSAPVSWGAAPATRSERAPIFTAAGRFPTRPLQVFGRDEAVRELTQQLREQRFVSIVGAGGIGKTTVALSVAHELLSEFGGAVHFLDLTAIEDPRLVAGALASQLGLTVVSESPVPVIVASLRAQRLLLVFDNCEHVVESAAALVEQIYREAPEVHLLTTSREALRADGERVHHLAPLECPPSETTSPTAMQALAYPAVQLFVEQVTRSGYPFELNDRDAPIVAELCRRLDGIALALELTARRVGVYGVKGIASLLDGQFRLLWRGRRTALPRHQTLSATLDWSYGLLSEIERSVLRRLAIFVGAFSLEAALAVVAEGLDAGEVAGALAMLVEKSLVSLGTNTIARYRLLDTTHTYARHKLSTSGEQGLIARRHSEYLCAALERLEAAAWKPHSAESTSFFVANLGNVRAGLEWSFSDQGDANIGMRLAAAAVPLFLHLSSLSECVAWAERAVGHLGQASGTKLELQLLSCFGLGLMYLKGNVPAARVAVTRALELAESLDDPGSQLLMLHGLYRFANRSGDTRELPGLTDRYAAVARRIRDPLADPTAHWLSAVTCTYIGDLPRALEHGRKVLNSQEHSSQLDPAAFGYFQIGTHCALTRTLWLLGFPDQAVEAARSVLREAEDVAHPTTLAYVLNWTVIVYAWVGDLTAAEGLVGRLIEHCTKHNLPTYAPAAMAWQGVLALLRGSPSGLTLLQTAIAKLSDDGYEMDRRLFSAELAEGFIRLGRPNLAHATICEALAWAKDRGSSCQMPNLLRVKGDVLVSLAKCSSREGERCLLESLQLAKHQGALSLELRTGTSLARLWGTDKQIEKALRLLGPIYERFSEGFHTPDLVAAAKLLSELRERIP